ncbi:hypothetical protein Ahy_B06g081362 [Arachis hypogaea]|uniref:Aminotransferase-like plant mobile domain-containing protein n=1 Tax=Arachis hypogaea TaxID=3818 RepID=A0A444YKU4_ARAHY|nr:hypothetical protein Ahy_B06g081362 [Arachis hypogaea]
MKKYSFFFNTHETATLRISLKITQTSLTFFAETVTGEESREDFARKKQKLMKTAKETAKEKMKTMVTKKDKPRYNAIAIVFKNLSKKKKDIVEEIGFGALAHVPKMNVSHALLRELIDCYNEYHGCLKTLHRKIYITPRKMAAALSISHDGNRFPEKVEYGKLNEPDKAIFDSLKCVALAYLTKSNLDMSVEGEENRQKFRRTFVVFVQKCFLLPTTVSMASTIHKPPIFHVDNIRQWDWANHVLSFLRKGIENKRKGKKQFLDGCVFVFMLIYFHETKFHRLDAPDAPPPPWMAH